MSNSEIIETIELFPILDEKLIDLLEGLSPDEWNAPTIAGKWTVKDIAAHLLDGCLLRRLSIHRDGYQGEKPGQITADNELVVYLNNLNADWVKAYKRISPRILIEQIRGSSREVYDFFKTLDPHGAAIFPVAWAGEDNSENWFDIARDYTERWHHQQQIRLAVNKFGIETPELYSPVLNTFMRALPHAYRNVAADIDTLIQFTVAGDAGGNWFLTKNSDQWVLRQTAIKDAEAGAVIPPEIAWRLFTKGIDKETARSEISFFGDQTLSGEIVNVLAIMA